MKLLHCKKNRKSNEKSVFPKNFPAYVSNSYWTKETSSQSETSTIDQPITIFNKKFQDFGHPVLLPLWTIYTVFYTVFKQHDAPPVYSFCVLVLTSLWNRQANSSFNETSLHRFLSSPPSSPRQSARRRGDCSPERHGGWVGKPTWLDRSSLMRLAWVNLQPRGKRDLLVRDHLKFNIFFFLFANILLGAIQQCLSTNQTIEWFCIDRDYTWWHWRPHISSRFVCCFFFFFTFILLLTPLDLQRFTRELAVRHDPQYSDSSYRSSVAVRQKLFYFDDD